MTIFPVIGELPAAEIHAIRLDGECYELAGSAVPIGIRPSPAVRAAIALSGRPVRLVAAFSTAAWVWGALPVPPTRAEFAAAFDARWRPDPRDRIRVMETLLRDGDVVRLGAAAVTSPLRTAIDLARFRSIYDDAERRTARALAELGGFDAADAELAMERGKNLAGKRQAAERLRVALSPN